MIKKVKLILKLIKNQNQNQNHLAQVDHLVLVD